MYSPMPWWKITTAFGLLSGWQDTVWIFWPRPLTKEESVKVTMAAEICWEAVSALAISQKHKRTPELTLPSLPLSSTEGCHAVQSLLGPSMRSAWTPANPNTTPSSSTTTTHRPPSALRTSGPHAPHTAAAASQGPPPRSAGRMAPTMAAPSSSTAALLWLRRDLRLKDHAALTAAAGSSAAYLLPCFALDPLDLTPRRSKTQGGLGVPKMGPHRCSFLLEALGDLKASLRERDSDLLFALRPPELALPEAAAALLARNPGITHLALYHHQAVGPEAAEQEDRVHRALEAAGERSGAAERGSGFRAGGFCASSPRG